MKAGRYWSWSGFIVPNWHRVVRVLLVVGGLVAGALIARGWSRAAELGYVLSDVGAIGVSLLSAQWLLLLLVNLGLGFIWLVFDRLDHDQGFLGWTRLLFAFLNRSLGHLQALFLWLALVFSVLERGYREHPARVLATRLSLAVLLIGAGPFVLDEMTRLFFYRVYRRAPPETTDYAFLVRRRLAVLIATAVAITWLALLAPEQADPIWTLGLAVFSGAMIRLRRPDKQPSSGYQERVRVWAQWGDRGVSIAALILVAGLMLHAVLPGHSAYGDDTFARTRWSPPPPPPVGAPAVSLFLVADTQFHELHGKRSGVHLDLVDGIVPVAVRPVELDLLSGATLAHFAEVYRSLLAERPDMLWAHLGDFGDLGCTDELSRVEGYVKRFAAPVDGVERRPRLAALVPGNHDSTFIGNFAWHPAWLPACERGIMRKDATNDELARLDYLYGAPGAITYDEKLLGGSDHRSLLARVARLGDVGGEPLYGIFADTSDYTGVTLGIAGAQGSISRQQKLRIIEALDQLDPAHGRDPAKRPRAILFLHHPFVEISGLAQARLDDIAKRARVIAVVSAHTHLAARRQDTLAGQVVPEFVIGSTIDPPQEAAVLEVWPGEAQRSPWVRVRTIAAVRQPRLSCDLTSAADLSAPRCFELVDRLRAHDDCKPLFEDHGAVEAALGEHTASSEVKRHGPQVEQGPRHFVTPALLRDSQSRRARLLLACVCREQRCAPPDDPLSDEADDSLLDRLFDRTSEDRDELVCLSWAASTVQGHKKDFWGYNHGLAMGFERAATYGELEMRSSPLAAGDPSAWACESRAGTVAASLDKHVAASLTR